MRVQCKVNNDDKHPTVKSDGGSQTELVLEELLKMALNRALSIPTWRYMFLHTEIAASKLLTQRTLQYVITKLLT